MFVDAEKRDIVSSLYEILTGTQHSAVFHRTRDQMFATANRCCGRFTTNLELQRRIDYGIIGFCAAAGENNLRRLTPEQRRQPFSRKVNGLPRHGGEAVSARRVAIILGQKRQHFLDHRRIKRRGSVVIEIDDFVIRHRAFSTPGLLLLQKQARRKSMSTTMSKSKNKKRQISSL